MGADFQKQKQRLADLSTGIASPPLHSCGQSRAHGQPDSRGEKKTPTLGGKSTMTIPGWEELLLSFADSITECLQYLICYRNENM